MTTATRPDALDQVSGTRRIVSVMGTVDVRDVDPDSGLVAEVVAWWAQGRPELRGDFRSSGSPEPGSSWHLGVVDPFHPHRVRAVVIGHDSPSPRRETPRAVTTSSTPCRDVRPDELASVTLVGQTFPSSTPWRPPRSPVAGRLATG